MLVFTSGFFFMGSVRVRASPQKIQLSKIEGVVTNKDHAKMAVVSSL
jgi:hypothetical protein